MYSVSDYIVRGCVFANNQVRPRHKKLASLMIYATDLCDSACKHCLIWAKRPAHILPKEEIYKIVKSKCVTKHTKVGLEGGEFLLHPDALEILSWFKAHHPNFDLLSNCLQPDKLISAVKTYTPQRLWISLDGTEQTYLQMRGKDGYAKVIRVIEELRSVLPVSLMFTLSPYNDFDDLSHVIEVAKQYGVDLRVGIYNNIDFFDTRDKAHANDIGSKKGGDPLKFRNVKEQQAVLEVAEGAISREISFEQWRDQLPASIRSFDE